MAGSPPAAILTLSLSAPFPVLALLRRLLLLPLLAPLMAVLILAALNPRPSLSLRLLIWRSPPLPIGLWIGAGAGGGALLSAAATALALVQGGTRQRPSGRRRQGLAAEHPEPWDGQPRRSGGPSWFTRASPGFAPTPQDSAGPQQAATGQGLGSRGGAGPQRAPGQPAPTVAVPFRVLHRPSGAKPPSRQAPPQPVAADNREAQPQPQVAPMTVGDDWEQNDGDDW